MEVHSQSLEENSSESSQYSEIGDYAADKTFYVPDCPYLQEDIAAHDVREDQEFRDVRDESYPDTPAHDSYSLRCSLSTYNLEKSGESKSTAAACDVGGAQNRTLDTTFINVTEQVRKTSVTAMSVLECCMALQTGFSVYKTKMFRALGKRRVWINARCDQLCWTSKKRDAWNNTADLQELTAVSCVNSRIAVSFNNGQSLSFVFDDQEHASILTRALSGLIPLQAEVTAPRNVALSEYERDEYTLMDDLFNGRKLQTYEEVHSYVLLCAAKGLAKSYNTRLAISLSDQAFYCMRFIPNGHLNLLVGAQERKDVLISLDHPNLVKYYECLADKERSCYYLVHENVSQGPLFASQSFERKGKFLESESRRVIHDILKALGYLHSRQIAHGDLRPGNLMVAPNGSIKLNPLGFISFGTGALKRTSILERIRIGNDTPDFMAPELCSNGPLPCPQTRHYGGDVWSVGVVLFFMIYGKTPFGGQNEEQIQKNICYDQLRFPELPETSKQLKDLLQRVLARKEWDKRMSLSDLQRHPWFGAKEDVSLKHGRSLE